MNDADALNRIVSPRIISAATHTTITAAGLRPKELRGDWIEAERDYVLLHTDLMSHLLRITMAELEERLAGTQLVRVHRSAFVRPDRVEEVNREGRSLSLVLTGGAEVQVGPSYVAATKAALGLE